jgi:hypothetical protein
MYAGRERHAGYEQSGHDGQARCTLCARAYPGSEPEWCEAAGVLLCEGCCERALSGDPSLLLEAAVEAGHSIDPLRMLSACMACERMAHRAMQAQLEAVDEESLPQ